MSIDMSQFHQVFFDESGEHLAELERLFLNLDIHPPESIPPSRISLTP